MKKLMTTACARRRTLVTLFSAALLAACLTGCASSTPASPTTWTQIVSLAGTYAGNASDSSGPGTMTWALTQRGANISGTMTTATPLGAVQFLGNISGKLSGATLTFTITVPQGGVSAFLTCPITITGSANGVTSRTIAGTYSGTTSCSAPFTNGQFALTKQ
jgi:hypothetical protein